jgi:hypothetical protein
VILYWTKVQLQEFVFLGRFQKEQRLSGFDLQWRLADGASISGCLLDGP